MAGLPPIPPMKKQLRFKDQEEEADPQNSRLPRLPTVQRRGSLQRQTSLRAYDPIMARFVKNGDRFFEGVKLNITQRNMRNWETLLAELSRRIDLPAGVRNIYTPEGGHRIKSLSQLEHQKTYVCASSEPFKKMDYSQVKNPDWRDSSRVRVSDVGLFSKPFSSSSLDPDASLNASVRSSVSLNASWTEPGLDSSTRQRRFFQRHRPMHLASISEDSQSLPHHDTCAEGLATLSPVKEQGLPVATKLGLPLKSLPPPQQAAQEPETAVKMLPFMVIRNGPPPREHTTIYANKNLIKSWEEAVQLFSKGLKTINGCLRLFYLSGEEVVSLSQLWQGDKTLIAAGNEKFDIVEFLSGSTASTGQIVKSSVKKSSLPSELAEGKGPAPVNISTPINPLNESLTPHNTTTDSNEGPDNDDSREEVKVEEGGEESKALAESNSEPSIIARGPVTTGKESSSDEQNTSGETNTGSGSRREHKRVVLSDSSEDTPTTPHQHLHPRQRRLSLPYSPIPPAHSHRRPQDSPVSASYPPLMFPPTPPSEVSPNRRPRPRRLLSMLHGDVRPASNSSSFLESPLLHTNRKGPFNKEHLHPQSPHSDISMDVARSLVDMMMTNKESTYFRSNESTISNLSSNSSRRPAKRRNVSIQTNFVDEHLSTFAEAEEIFTIGSSKKSRSEQNDADNAVSSQTDLTCPDQDLEASAAASQLHKVTKEKYHIGMAIAEGSFAVVKHCTDKQENREFLLRAIKKASVFGRDDKIQQEVEIMRMTRHENVLSVQDYWETGSEICMVMEPIEGGDLFDAILHCQHFSESDAMEGMRQLGLALVYLHANTIVHRGVKPENIFLSIETDRTWTLKLAGFSLATRTSEPLTLACGNEYYRAPEMTSGRGYGTKADVWSAGVIAYILLSGIMPFRKRRKSQASVCDKVLFPNAYWKNVTNTAKDFIHHLLVISPQERYSSSHLMQHSWFKQKYASSDLSKRLMEYLSNRAASKVALVPILTVTALDHDIKKFAKKRKSINSDQKQQ